MYGLSPKADSSVQTYIAKNFVVVTGNPSDTLTLSHQPPANQQSWLHRWPLCAMRNFHFRYSFTVSFIRLSPLLKEKLHLTLKCESVTRNIY